MQIKFVLFIYSSEYLVLIFILFVVKYYLFIDFSVTVNELNLRLYMVFSTQCVQYFTYCDII